MDRNKIDSLTLHELVELKNIVNEIVLRTHIVGRPDDRWQNFNQLLNIINRTIEERIYNEYIK